MHAALTYPEKVEALVLVGTSSQCNERAAHWYEALALKAERDGSEAILDELGASEERRAFPPEPAGLAKVARCMASLYPEPLTPLLGRIACPALVIVGAEDFIGVGGSVIIQRNLSGSRLEIVEGRGHTIHQEDPDGFGSLVMTFLEGLEDGTKREA
jgi:pimeloyl-ACP methyl ester carboxylesterase